MAKPNLSSNLIEWEFTEDEIKQLPGFSPLQRQFLQNELALAAGEKSRLKFDPEHPMLFTQQEAELQGKMGMLEYLLSIKPPAVITI